MNKYPTIDEFECPDYKCKDCKHFKFVKPDGSGCTHRFDHKLMEYARPWFDCAPEEMGCPCSDFEPDGRCPRALPYWKGYEHWVEWMNRQNEEDYAEVGRIYNRDISKKLIGFRLKQDPNAYYYVKLTDYINNTMWEDNKLKTVKVARIKKVKIRQLAIKRLKNILME